MKKCPQCGRKYTDETLNFCLEDGEWLLSEPPASPDGFLESDEPATAILSEPGVVTTGSTVSEQATKVFSSDTDQTAILHTETQAEQQKISSELSKNHIRFANKGVKLLVALGIAAVVLVGGFFGYRYFGSGGRQINSIAVMPFVNNSGNHDIEYLSDGMTETLIRTLSQLPSLNVKSRSSVFRYKGTDTDAKAVGKELGVQAVLNGRFVQRGDQLTLDLELINTDNDNVIWADQYDRKASDLVSLQNDIARDVSSKLKLKLTNADQQKLAKNYTVDPEAYRLYLQGRFYWNKRAGREFEKAGGLFSASD